MTWDLMLHNPPWWLTVVAGSVLAVFLSAVIPNGVIPMAVSSLVRVGRRDAFIGTWYFYDTGFVEGKPHENRECRYEVRRGVPSPYVASSFFPADADRPQYKSRLVREAGRLIEHYKATDHRSSGYCSFPEPYGNIERLYGFWVSTNYGDPNKILACGPILFSRFPIPRERLENEIKMGYDIYGSVPTMLRLHASLT